MKRLHFTKSHRAGRLHEELLAAVAELQPVLGTDGRPSARLTFEHAGTDLWLTVPDDADEAAIAAVVAAHDPTKPSQAELHDAQNRASVDDFRTNLTAALANWASLTAAERAAWQLRTMKAVAVLLDRRFV